jgi:phosphoribosylpyrophosphate synthetase
MVGRTFINIAKYLKEAHKPKKVHLFVSHGIFSYGTKLDYIDDIYCTNSFKDMSEYDSNVNVMPAPFYPIPEPTTLEKLKGNT